MWRLIHTLDLGRIGRGFWWWDRVLPVPCVVDHRENPDGKKPILPTWQSLTGRSQRSKPEDDESTMKSMEAMKSESDGSILGKWTA